METESKPLAIKQISSEIIEIEGRRYSHDFFRHFALSSNRWCRVIEDEHGNIVVEIKDISNWSVRPAQRGWGIEVGGGNFIGDIGTREAAESLASSHNNGH